ncbi:hypothetical protein [Nocardia stercoris]|uniref:Uncharacterized protein n=1 Tax=Nocardia stercoris TaxID=2483361 RepID=A0A3M2L4L3_9NOCA|nr:hypothetical protein [Nocardia stercoris]RMI32609.1 hypothetical protein EBN03_11555 [Nocardia stercoris]
MSESTTRDQLAKLAAVLHVPTERIDYLSAVGGERLAVLREQIVAALHTRYPAEYRRYSALAGRVPLRYSLPLATRILPPRILGRSLSTVLLAGQSDASLALLAQIDPVIVADAAPFIDPAVVGELAQWASPELIHGVMEELMARNDFDTADLFVDSVIGQVMTGTPAPATARPAPARGLRARLGRFRRRA